MIYQSLKFTLGILKSNAAKYDAEGKCMRRRVQNMNDSFDRQTTYCVPKGGPRDFCSFCRQNALRCRLFNSVECSDATKHAQQCQQKHSMTGDQIENRIEILFFQHPYKDTFC